jgi:hypothetical protein
VDNYVFTIRVTCCAECPHKQHWPFGLDCSFNNCDWPFKMIDEGKGGISPDCPYRKADKNGGLHHYFIPIKE